MQHVELKTVPVITGFTCDRCGEIVGADDEIELQEGHRIDFVGGYGSVFGDGKKVECDICQHCLKELVGSFCKIS